MSKQVEDNKEMQEDLKKREAELKREMEEKRQVRCNVSQCIWSALSVWFLRGVVLSMCWHQHLSALLLFSVARWR